MFKSRSWKVFFGQRRAWIGLGILAFIACLSLFAELWSNECPVYLVRDDQQGQHRTYYPIFFTYPAESFGVTDSLVVDYRALVQQDHDAGKTSTFAVFPLNPWSPNQQGSKTLAHPDRQHWLGTDNLGRDVVARLLYGARVSLTYGMLFWLGAFLIGIGVGGLQGYFGGLPDFIVERAKELFEIIPVLSVVILVNGLTHSQSFWVTLGAVVAFAWIGVSSQMRAQFLALRKREFCEAAIGAGATHRRVIFRHILPNAITPILTLAPFTISAGISTLTVLDYLGFGLNPPTPSLGELLAQGRSYIEIAPWLLIAPTAVLAAMLISINLVGEALRKAFDPRS